MAAAAAKPQPAVACFWEAPPPKRLATLRAMCRFSNTTHDDVGLATLQLYALPDLHPANADILRILKNGNILPRISLFVANVERMPA